MKPNKCTAEEGISYLNNNYTCGMDMKFYFKAKKALEKQVLKKMVDGKDTRDITRQDLAREYFKAKGLTYDDITEGDICALLMILNKNIKQACRNREMSVGSMRMSQKIKSKYKTNGRLIECYLFINSHYFTQRECISFNKDGFIGFCGWADDANTEPIVKSFIKWVNELKEEEEEEES